jgi:hypothetical protein
VTPLIIPVRQADFKKDLLAVFNEIRLPLLFSGKIWESRKKNLEKWIKGLAFLVYFL